MEIKLVKNRKKFIKNSKNYSKINKITIFLFFYFYENDLRKNIKFDLIIFFFILLLLIYFYIIYMT
jgi:hypothetical protein